MTHPRKRSGKHPTVRGFTLVELLVVIAIIGALLTLALPSLYKALVYARRAACQHNLHGVGIAFRMYLETNDYIMPVAAQMPSLQLSDEPSIAEALGRNLDRPEILRCPADVVDNYYEREGSSYEYHTMLGGRPVGESFLSERWGVRNTPVLNDYKPYHGKPRQRGSMNYLFADSHVGYLGD
ncbi:MAG: type II secretion system protein [Planctomycetota bacterium]|jgi:prepilin-type N-terminal cleavage/methylation domain-containing protein/prepilin-type processing-associated H-X9-DG protein